MSEAERLRRQEYKRNRKKWMFIQAVAIAVMVVLALGSAFVYDRMNRTYYIEYTESGNVDYKVNLKSNNFFDEDYVEKDRSYVASLVKDIEAELEYMLLMDASSVGFDYTYSVDAQLIIANKSTGDHIYEPTFEIVPETTRSIENTSSIKITEVITVDYNKYNTIASNFINAYDLKGATSTLVVTMKVDVLGNCDEFEDSSANSYFMALNVPLTEENFSIYTTSSSANGESKVLACVGAVCQNLFIIIGIVAAILAALLAVGLAVFVYITRNEDVNYTNKVRRLVSAYRSFIQQIDGQFNTAGYQIVPIKTFGEMLGIRDTIQSPILMFENRDQTMTEFVIPTNTKILYTFEIKVDNYDEIYGESAEESEPEPAPVKNVVVEPEKPEEPIEEAVILNDDVTPEDIAEAMAAPDVVLDEIDYVEDDDEDYEGTEEEPGIEVVGVVWPEKAHKNKVYRYDPDGEKLSEGDMVLVPTRDAARNREVIRKAAIAHANHKIDPALHPHVIKKIIGVIKKRAEAALTPKTDTDTTNE